MMATRKIWPTPGGVHPPEHKQQSLTLPLAELGIAPQLILPLSQHMGAPAEPIVGVGDRVLTGQLIARSEQTVSANVHASSSGTVTAIEERPLPHPSGLLGLCIVIDTDGKDEWTTFEPCQDYRHIPREEILEKIHTAGVVGMGGAGFPTAVKLSPSLPISTLIINGTECEPYITADDILMRTQADEIIAGAQLLSHLLNEPQEVVVAIEDNKPEAIEIMRLAAQDTNIEVVALPTKYPSGGERQLVQMITGKEVPHGRLPAHVGAVCQNVATIVAASRAVRYGEPLIARITTVTGNAFATQRNVNVRLGTPISYVLQQHDYDSNKATRLVIGGPMMGFNLLSEQAPIIKTTNCLMAPTLEEAPSSQPPQACIRCSLCAEACPATLLPQQLYWYARAHDAEKLKSYHLFDCIECGACSFACPSHIPLVQYYRAAKGEIREQERERKLSDRARQRFEFHKERIEKEKEARIKAREEAAQKAKRRKAEAAKTAPAATSTEPKDAIPVNATNTADPEKMRAQYQRSLLSNRDKLAKLKQLLSETEANSADDSPDKADSIRAQIKGVENKCQNLQEKLIQLDQQINNGGEAKKVSPNTDVAEIPPRSLTEQEAAIRDKMSWSEQEKSQHAVQQLLQQLNDVEKQLEQAKAADDEENTSALQMSANILRQKIYSLQESLANGAAGDNQKRELSSVEDSAMKSAVERAMERVLQHSQQESAEYLRTHIETLQARLQAAQQRLNQADTSESHHFAELSQAVEQLEQKLSVAFDQLSSTDDTKS